MVRRRPPGHHLHHPPLEFLVGLFEQRVENLPWVHVLVRIARVAVLCGRERGKRGAPSSLPRRLARVGVPRKRRERVIPRGGEPGLGVVPYLGPIVAFAFNLLGAFGDADSTPRLVQDAEPVLRHLQARHGVLVGHAHTREPSFGLEPLLLGPRHALGIALEDLLAPGDESLQTPDAVERILLHLLVPPALDETLCDFLNHERGGFSLGGAYGLQCGAFLLLRRSLVGFVLILVLGVCALGIVVGVAGLASHGEIVEVANLGSVDAHAAHGRQPHLLQPGLGLSLGPGLVRCVIVGKLAAANPLDEPSPPAPAHDRVGERGKVQRRHRLSVLVNFFLLLLDRIAVGSEQVTPSQLRLFLSPRLLPRSLLLANGVLVSLAEPPLLVRAAPPLGSRVGSPQLPDLLIVHALELRVPRGSQPLCQRVRARVTRRDLGERPELPVFPRDDNLRVSRHRPAECQNLPSLPRHHRALVLHQRAHQVGRVAADVDEVAPVFPRESHGRAGRACRHRRERSLPRVSLARHHRHVISVRVEYPGRGARPAPVRGCGVGGRGVAEHLLKRRLVIGERGSRLAVGRER